MALFELIYQAHSSKVLGFVLDAGDITMDKTNFRPYRVFILVVVTKGNYLIKESLPA